MEEVHVEPPSSLDLAYKPSGDIVAREIEGVLVIVPIATGVGDIGDELFTLNDTGKAIWDRLDGKRTVNHVIQELMQEYDAAESEVATDVLGLLHELIKRKMVVLAQDE